MTAPDPIRVLVVDDSAFARKVMRELLSAQPGIVVIGIARDGADALEKITELKPDVVTLDLVMPELDGLGVLHALSAADGPRVVVVSTSDSSTQLGIAALEAGAVEIVAKPTALATDRLYEIGAPLIRAVRAAASARHPLPRLQAPRDATLERRPRAAASAPRPAGGGNRIIVVGTSTGGVQALTVVLGMLPAELVVPVVAVLHIPPGYTEALARRLNGMCALEVVEASAGMRFDPGHVVIAQSGHHLKIRRVRGEACAYFDLEPHDKPHCPSVDVLFESAAEVFGAGVTAAVLTGMGDDGLIGARAVRAAGGAVITEAESTCIVYGMPRAVREAGLSNVEVPLEGIVAEIVRRN